MKLNYKNIISFNLLLIILFSTIGFNIISTICDGCDIENTSIAIINNEEDLSCECCIVDAHEMSCCKSEDNHDSEHHHSTSKFAKLNFDSPAAKAKVFKTEVPVLFLNIIYILFDSKINSFYPVRISIIDFSPPPAGRILLNLICTLRN